MSKMSSEPKKVSDAPILISDYMQTKLIKFTAEDSILKVMEVFAQNHISGAPVVDERGYLIGIISEADCLKQISESRYFNMPILERSVEHFMTKNVETIEASRDIFEAAAIFLKNSRRRLPVLKDGKLVGQISRKDIVVAALKLTGRNYK